MKQTVYIVRGTSPGASSPTDLALFYTEADAVGHRAIVTRPCDAAPWGNVHVAAEERQLRPAGPVLVEMVEYVPVSTADLEPPAASVAQAPQAPPHRRRPEPIFALSLMMLAVSLAVLVMTTVNAQHRSAAQDAKERPAWQP